MSTVQTTTSVVDLADEEYLSVALANGFSKGTANVSAADMKKLRPLVAHYRKKKHPFRACVRDNRKRFGPLTEKYCAIIKDLIHGSTKWRGKDKKLAEMSEEEIAEFQLSHPDLHEFVAYMAEVDEEEIEEFVEFLAEADAQMDEQALLAAGEVVWKANEGYTELRREVERALREQYPAKRDDGGVASYSDYWVEDIADGKALMCDRGTDYFVVAFERDGENVVLEDQDDWKPVERAWVEENVELSERTSLVAELFFADGEEVADGEDGLIWKTIMREGTWAFSPGKGQQPVKKPITVTRYGKSDPSKLVISMGELYKNFKDGAIEHVTIPTSHADKVDENTGYIRDMKLEKDDRGRWTLAAAHDFTEPEIKDKVKRGSIANTSAGVLFDYVNKELGKAYRAVIGHVALTNKPWLNGMKPFGVNASEDVPVLAFSEEPYEDEDSSAGKEEQMADNENAKTFEEELAERLGLSEAEIKAQLAENKRLQEERRESGIADQVKTWEEAGKDPALVKEAKDIMMADEGEAVLNLSEGGKDVSLSASDIVKRLVEKAPGKNLSEDPVTDQDQSKGRKPEDNTDPENQEAQLSEDEKRLATQYFLEGSLSEEEAVAKAKKELGSGDGKTGDGEEVSQ